ncbi:MAG TPA: glycosyltransferase family 4 protein [Solirubrobacteraceae bacterium]
MRVLAIGNVYPPHHLGGYEVIWQGAMRHLRSEGHQARILTTQYLGRGVAPHAAEDPDVHRELDWYWHDHVWRTMRPAQRLRLERANARIFDRHLREFRPDVITWWPLGGMSLSLIERGRRAGLPALLFVFDYWPAYGPQRDLWTRMWAPRPRAAVIAERLTGIPTRLNLSAAGRWLFCSRSMRDETLSLGLDIPDQTILQAGVDRSYLSAPREDEAPPWRWRLLYLGRVVQQKGVRTAIESLVQLPAEAALRIVGEGDPDYRAELEATARELGVADRVRFEASYPREALVDVFRAADAVLFPVIWPEPFGLVPLEAMALGRPVVATGRGGSGDYLEDRGNALLFEAGDARALAAALQTLASDQALRGRLRAQGYETAVAHSEDAFNARALEEMLAASRAGGQALAAARARGQAR